MLCSDLLDEYSSALSLPMEGVGGARGRSAVSSTRLLFDVLDKFLRLEGGQSSVAAIPTLLNAFLLQNKYVCMVPLCLLP